MVLRTQVGDVVQIVDDKHIFSKAEMTNGQYRIIDMPGVDPETMQSLCDPVYDKDETTILKRRKFTIDEVALKTGTLKDVATATPSDILSVVIER